MLYDFNSLEYLEKKLRDNNVSIFFIKHFILKVSFRRLLSKVCYGWVKLHDDLICNVIRITVYVGSKGGFRGNKSFFL